MFLKKNIKHLLKIVKKNVFLNIIRTNGSIMKKIVLIVMGLIFLTNLFAQSNRRVMLLSGNISDKYRIKMTLTFDGDHVLGFYFYEKYQSNIFLEGFIKGDQITLNEVCNNDSDCKNVFVGSIKNNFFSGIWSDKVKNITLSFHTIIDSNNNISIPKEIIEIEGFYEEIFNSNKNTSTVELKYIFDDLFYFEISTADQSGCSGQIEGLINLIGLKSGKYSNKYCEEILFTILNNNLIVTEKQCDFHGIYCFFSGEYKKVKKVMPKL